MRLLSIIFIISCFNVLVVCGQKTIWSEDFEVSIDNYSKNSYCGDCNWNRSGCKSFLGSYSLYCAGLGSSCTGATSCNSYPNNLCNWYKITYPINIPSCYNNSATGVSFFFRMWRQIGDEDQVIFQYRINGGSWQQKIYTGKEETWAQKGFQLGTNISSFEWQFDFLTNNIGYGEDGVFIDNMELIVWPPDNPTTPVSNSPQCETVTISRSSSPPSGISWYWQTSSSGTSTLLGSGPTLSVSSSGTYYLRSRNSCGDWSLGSTSVAVTVNQEPTTVSVSGGGTQCGGSMTLTASGGTGGTIYYQGTTSNGTSTSTPSSSVNVAASGTYYFRARSSAGCWGEQGSATVTINPVPSNTAVSGGGSFPVSATLTASGGIGGTIYFQGTTSNGTSTAIPATSRTVTASGTYYFRSRSSAGCWGEQGSATVTITAGSGIESVTGKTPLCIGESATYTANNVVLEGGTGAWSSSNPAIATVSSTGAVTGVSPGACNIIYTITGGTSGTVSEQQQVTISPDGSIASISGPVDWCVGGVGNYTANSVNLSGGTGAWGSSNSGIISISSSGEATAVSAGQANITYTITGGCGGTISKSLAVTVSSGKAVTSVTGLKSICVNTTTPFVANGVVTAGGQAAWSSSDVTVATVTQTGSVTGLSEGACNIIYTISGGCGETVSAQQSLSVAPKPVGGTVSLSICSDIALNYNLQSNVNTLGNSIPSTFTWTVASSPEVTGAAASSTAKNIIADRLRNISGNDEKVVYTITPTAINGCKGDPFTLTATIKPEPAGADDAVVTCSGNALDYDLQEDNINIKGNGVSSAFTWTAAANTAVSGFSGSTMTSAIIADNIRNVSGTEQTIIYSVTPTGINGCVGEQFTISAKIQPAPVIILKWGDILICSNKQNLYTSYKWMKNDIPVSGAAGQYYPTDKKAGTYRVQTVDKNGCSSMSNEISVSGSGSLHVFPNPASRTVIFSLDDEPAGTARISLVNAAGLKLREYQVEKTSRQWEKEIPVDDLDEGIYFLTITIGRENVYYSKLLIRRE